MTYHRITRAAALGSAIAVLAAPTAFAQDFRSPDAIDAGQSAVVLQQDMRTPDARDATPAAEVGLDMRSPDVRDAAEGRGTFNAPEVVVVKSQAPAPASGIDWADAGIGAGTTFGLVLLGLGAALLTVHRRQVRPSPGV